MNLSKFILFFVLKRAIQKYLEDEMAEIIIQASISEGDIIKVDFNEEEVKIFTSIEKEAMKALKDTKASEN